MTAVRGKGLRLLLPMALAAGLTLSLAACKSSEEEATDYYQSGLDLLAEGDVDRAVVQFRNVFNIDGTHYEARKKLAEVMLEQGNPREAYSQYLRLAEQYPDDLPTRIALSRIAFDQAQPEEFRRHVTRAMEIAPDDVDVKILDLAQRYADATRTNDNDARIALATEAEPLIEARPDDPILLGMQLDKAAHDKDLDLADRLTLRLIELQPDRYQRYQQRLALLIERGDMPAVETHLRQTIAKFPDDRGPKVDLLRFLMSQNRPNDAESYLREMAAASPADDPSVRVDLIRFIEQQRGIDAARTELDRIIADGGEPLVFEVLRSGFDFRSGKTDEAIADLRKVLAGVTEPSDRSRDAKVQLARMLVSTGDDAGARAEVGEVLTQNAAHPGALKMQAVWDTLADKTDDAIMSLRGVLDQSPEDVEAMNLMADAYMRAGEMDLARDYLTQAADASGNAPEQSLRLAQSLFAEGRYRPAEDAILPALRLAPDNLQLLNLLGRVYLAMPDLPRAEGVVTRLRELGEQPGNAQARVMADELELNRLAAVDGQQAAMSYLQDLAGKDDAGLGARVELIRARLSSGQIAEAQEAAKALEADRPDDRMVNMVVAMTEAAAGETDAARDRLRGMIADQPRDLQPYLALVRLDSVSGDLATAEATIAQGLEALPDNPDLLWAKAGIAERNGDIDGAIAIFDQLYERNSESIIIANNLASLLSTWKSDDPEALARASTVARRLKDTREPAFMDTYGWIQHLNGASQAGLPYLEGAAARLQNDPMVQIHLGVVQEAVGQNDAARAQLRKGLDMLPADEPGPSIIRARAALERLENPAGASSEAAPEGEDQTATEETAPANQPVN
ncbi:tetratricopeptide repeat protein [Paracoccus caeni]|uniref:Tetratricopeptide repeat protein n=1 Tax=Paracoccus caeni TaxID=657651 RepID=A0A934SIJ9_9RHOB|nr:tetratricopeptide repeat protein [Paracoccus caeni]MBK4218140.1 tetratricopeptide repeat protein [Paracoccus caeni]